VVLVRAACVYDALERARGLFAEAGGRLPAAGLEMADGPWHIMIGGVARLLRAPRAIAPRPEARAAPDAGRVV